MFEFLQIVIYIPNPIIIAAKTDNGTSKKKLVLRPMTTFHVLTIKL